VPERYWGYPLFSPAAIVTLFANAHESEVPPQLILEKEMDLFNNEIGITLGSSNLLTSNSVMSDIVMQKLINGELKYLNPLDFTLSPYFDMNGDQIQDCPTCLNGITPSTVLKQTNL